MIAKEAIEYSTTARALVATNKLFIRLYHHCEVLSPCPLPKTGPAILVSNHTSGADPLFIQAVSQRVVTWMMAKEFYELPSLNWIFRSVYAIPVSRSGRDMAATRAAMRTLQNGGVLGIFPEGRIEKSRALLPFQIGVAMLAIKNNVPVYPAFLDGSQRGKDILPAVVTPNSVALRFGGPIEFDRQDTSRPTLDTATAAIQRAVQTLADQTPASSYRNL